jgi:hypothetical protein
MRRIDFYAALGGKSVQKEIFPEMSHLKSIARPASFSFSVFTLNRAFGQQASSVLFGVTRWTKNSLTKLIYTYLLYKVCEHCLNIRCLARVKGK